MPETTKLTEEELEFLHLVGYILLSFKKWEKAAVIYDLLQQFMPDNIQITKARALIAANLGNYEKAIQYTDRIIERADRNSDIKNALIIKTKTLWALGRKEEARECFAKALAISNEVQD